LTIIYFRKKRQEIGFPFQMAQRLKRNALGAGIERPDGVDVGRSQADGTVSGTAHLRFADGVCFRSAGVAYSATDSFRFNCGNYFEDKTLDA
jgi:hypothetical protein